MNNQITASQAKQSNAYIINSGLIFTFFAILFTFEKNFAYTATLLLLMSLFMLPTYYKTIRNVPAAFPIWIFVTSFLLLIDLNFRDKGGEYLLERPIFLLSLLPIYYYLSKVGFSIKALIWGIYIATIFGGIYGFYLAKIIGLGRAWGTSLNPILFGNLGTFLLIFAISRFYYLVNETTRPKLELSIVTLSVVCALLMIWSSGSRGPLVTLTLLITFFTLYFKLYKLWKFYAVALAVSLSAIGYYHAFPNHLINQRLTSAATQFLNTGPESNIDRSTSIRLEMWATSVEIAKIHPIIGSGYVKHKALYVDAIKKLGLNEAELSHFKQHHSDFFNLLAYYGVTGLLIYTTLLYLLIATYIKNRKSLTIDLQTLFLAHIVCFIGVGLTDAVAFKINGSAILMVPATIFLGYINYKTSRKPI